MIFFFSSAGLQIQRCGECKSAVRGIKKPFFSNEEGLIIVKAKLLLFHYAVRRHLSMIIRDLNEVDTSIQVSQVYMCI